MIGDDNTWIQACGSQKNCGLTQAQVAGRLFLTTQSVSSWECGNSIPDTEKIPEIAALYGVTTDWRLTGRLPSEEILELTSDLSDRLFSEQRMATSFTDEHIAEYIKETNKYSLPLMEKARKEYPEYSNQLFLIRYHMNSVMTALLHHMCSGIAGGS